MAQISRAQVGSAFQGSPFFAKQTAVPFYSMCFCKNNTFMSSLTVTVSRQKGVWKRSLCADAGKKNWHASTALLWEMPCSSGSLLIWSHILSPFNGPYIDKHQGRGMYHSKSTINKEKGFRIWTKAIFNKERGLRQIRKNITNSVNVRKFRE